MACLARSMFSKVLVSQLRVDISQRHCISRKRCSGAISCIATYTTNTAGDTDKPKKTKKSRKSRTKHDSDVTSIDKSTSDSQKKKKRRGRKVLSEEEILDSLIGPFIPLEGIAEKSASDKAFEHANLTLEKQDSPDGRFYHCQTSTSSYSFPSVTTVLDKTGTKSYPLLIWKRKLVEEHGKDGFEVIRKNTLKAGSDFHKVRCTQTGCS